MFDDWHQSISKSIRWPALVGVVTVRRAVRRVRLVGDDGADVQRRGRLWPVRGDRPEQDNPALRGRHRPRDPRHRRQRVETGQDLSALDDTASRAEARRYELKRFDLVANTARLDAVQLSRDSIEISADDDPAPPRQSRSAKIIAVQKAVFAAGREAFSAQRPSPPVRSTPSSEQIPGLEAQKASNDGAVETDQRRTRPAPRNSTPRA